MNSNQLFEKLWQNYSDENPSVCKVLKLLHSHDEKIVNDHIAFRTFDHPKMNIEVLAVEFLALGFVEMGEYHFNEKKLYAKHYKHPSDESLPLVFISQLKVNEFSPFLQQTVNELAIQLGLQINPKSLVSAGRLWGVPSYEVYQKLLVESEYAAWLYVNGFKANHFTVSVNNLKKLNNIYDLNSALKSAGFSMNNPANEVQGTPAELLEQSSIKADVVETLFVEGNFPITSCYFEFAKRYVDKDGKLFVGFIAKSADKIFESTNMIG